MKELSIIIVSYNNQDVIEECLDSIKRYNDIGDRLQTILVEQSDTEDIYDWAKSKYPWVEIIRAQNKGFGAGNNRGAEIAKGEYLLFLNPDTILVEPVANFTVEKFKEDTRLGLFGVKLIKRDGSFCSSFQMLIPYGFINKLIYKLCSKKDMFLRNRMYIEGADIFIRSDLFKSIGCFDENLFMYCEEPDLCLRVKAANYKLNYFPEKKIIHLQGACSNQKLANMFGRQLDSFKYICKKHGMNFTRIIKKDMLEHTIIKLLMMLHGANKHIEGIEYRNILINTERERI